MEPLEMPPLDMTPLEQGAANEGVDISLAGAEPGLPTITEGGEI